jgi:acetyl-CoA synthetase
VSAGPTGRDLLLQTSYEDARRDFRWSALWDLVDGDRTRLNLAHECVDRHPGDATALRIQFADGRRAEHTFAELAGWSSRFAHFLEAEGVARGDRVAIMLEPSLAFYGAVFGAIKRGAIAVPLFTLFGPDALALRIDDCAPRLLLVEHDADRWRSRFPSVRVVALDARLLARLAEHGEHYAVSTAADDLAVFQYTSGTTRELPEAVRHSHRSVVTLMVAALYGVGLKPGDRFFCPSSPAWGHGLWHGTIAPLALGLAAGAYSGKFDPAHVAGALDAFRVTNFAAAPTVYRMLREVDGDGYVHHAGRSDDVIISAGWTMSALEIERALQSHPDVVEAAVIGVPDARRGQIPKAFVVAARSGPAFEEELKAHVQNRLSRHEYPRAIEIVDALPKTPAGKVNRKALRDR